MKLRKWSVILLLAGFIVGSFSMASYAVQEKDLPTNKDIAALFLKETLEKGNIDAMVEKHISPDIQVEYPEAYKVPVLGTHRVKGKEALIRGGKAWKDETRHKIRIADVIAEGNTVVVLAYMDRVFRMPDKEKSFRNHPLVYIFKFKDGKIYKIIGIFDVLEEVEQFKAKKYKF